MRNAVLAATIVAAALCQSAVAQTLSTQAWPTHPITMIVPFAAGGPVDITGRLMAQHMSTLLGQTVIVENVPGAGSMTGANRVAQAPPDGTTFLYGNSSTHTFSQIIHKKPPYDAVADFAPVAVFVENSKVLLVRKDLPVNNLSEFIAYTRAHQKTMQFGSAGLGSAAHITCVLLNSTIGVNVTHVPYRGLAPAMQDLTAGRIDYVCEIISSAVSHIKSGNVRALALLSPHRSDVLPELPTADEQGLKGFDLDAWNAFFFPKGTPAAIVQKLAKATSDAVDIPEVRDRLKSLGLNIAAPERRNPDYVTRVVKSDLEKWRAPVLASGIAAMM
jgi:tripartite-type tricarboxylate transporter receptor subunit TctC